MRALYIVVLLLLAFATLVALSILLTTGGSTASLPTDGSEQQEINEDGLRPASEADSDRRIADADTQQIDGADPGNNEPLNQFGTTIRGVLQIIGSQPKDNPDVSGQMQVLVMPRNRQVSSHIEIHHGNWELRCPYAVTSIQIKSITINSKSVLLIGSPVVTGKALTDLVQLRGYYNEPINVFAVSREIHELLPNITLRKAGKLGRGVTGDPYQAELIGLEITNNPIQLPRASGVFAYYVGANGYSWRRVVIDHSDGSDRYVTLEPAGELNITIASPQTSQAFEVAVYCQGENEYPLPIGRQSVQPWQAWILDGVLPGQYVIRATCQPIKVGTAPSVHAVTTVRASQTTTVVLHPEPSAQSIVRLNYTFCLESNQLEKLTLEEREDLRLSIVEQPANGSENIVPGPVVVFDSEDERDDGSVCWEGRVQDGSMVVAVLQGIGEVGRYEIRGTSPRRCRLEMPARIPVTVRAFESESGEPLDNCGLVWWREDGSGQLVGSGELRWEEDGGVYTMLASPGPLFLDASGSERGTQRIIIEPGKAVYDVTFGELASIGLELQESGQCVELEGDWWGFVRAYTADGAPLPTRLSWSSGRKGMALKGIPEGGCILRFPGIPGYEPIDPVLISSRESRPEVYRIELVRR